MRLLLAFRTSFHARDWLESGFLTKLAKVHKLEFVYVPAICSTSTLQAEEFKVRKYGKSIRLDSATCKKYNLNSTWQNNFFGRLRIRVSHFVYFLSQVRNHAKAKFAPVEIWGTLSNDGNEFIRFASFLLRIRLAWLMVWLGNSFLRLSCPRLFGKRYDFVILAYNPFGISGFTDDVIRTARALKIPSIGLQMNLDNIIARFPLERPNYLGVWGDTHFLWAKAFYQYPTNNIFSVGTPRVRHLWSLRPSPSEARKKLALNSDDFVILYAPSSRRHDEKYVLEALSKAIQQNLFGKKVVVLLKKQKGKETEFSGSLQAGEKEPFDLPSVVTWDEADKSGPTPLRRFPYIYAACDAIMSPFSTMVYEAALLGKPSLILNYDPRDYGETLGHSMDWKAIQLATWHFSIKNNEGAIFCRSRADLIPSIRKLIRQVDSPFARELTRHAACSNIYFGPKDPAEKLLEFLKIKYKCAIKKREE